MNIETSRSRGLHHLQPAFSVMDGWEKIGMQMPEYHLVKQYASELNDAISFFHRKYDPWVQSFGGKSYSEITAISQHMLLKFLGKTLLSDIEKFTATPFPKLAHLTWRIISAIDDFADMKDSTRTEIADITDSEGTRVSDMIKELIKIPMSERVGLWFIQEMLKYIKKHENTDLTFEKAKKSKEKTTGLFTMAATLGAWPFLLTTFPKEMSRYPIKKFVQHSVAGSLIAQCLDDIADFRSESETSSLLIAAAKETEETELISKIAEQNSPITISALLERDLVTPKLYTEYFQSLIGKMPNAPEDMTAYFKHQFFNLQSD